MKKGELKKHFSTASATLLQKRMPGPEALMEEWLRRTPDADLKPVVRLLHDWAISNKERGFYHLGKYFDQSRDEIDFAAELFAKKRQELYKAPTKSGYRMLELFLLYDCLIHTGSIARGEQPMAYLDTPASKPPETVNALQLLTDAKRHGKIYNFTLHEDGIRIHNKKTYHSEIAMGESVITAGEIGLVMQNGKPEILINWKSGHYRPLPSSLRHAVKQIRRELGGRACKITLCDDFLMRYKQTSATKPRKCA